MGYVLMQQGEEAFIKTTLLGAATSPAIPAGGANWGLALASTLIGASPAFAFKERQMSASASGSTIQEIGQTTPAGYARQSIARSAIGWPTASGHPGASWTYTAAAKTFSFSGTPSATGAQSWWVCKSTTVIASGADDVMFGADLAAVRNFGTSDTETVTVSYQQT